ncbi:hypothetical protein [Streptomyces sp. NPDC048002]|uniref:hypothetical protein n=1 Tax=unclassified Streptomyces TaxID=2593676 RepID=UPI0033FF5443
MPADEVTHGTDVDTSRARTGPRHAAPKKPLFTRFHMPAGKAIALAAMPTAVLMGMGFTPTLANAEDQPAAKSLTADEYKDCVALLEGESASPTPSASESTTEAPAEEDTAEPTPTPSATAGDPDDSSSSDSGSDDEAEPEASGTGTTEPQSGATATASPSPSPSESEGNLLEDIGDAIEGIFTGGQDDTASAEPSPSATPSASESPSAAEEEAAEPAEDAVDEVTDTVEDAAKDTTDAAADAAEDTAEEVEEAAEEATATPSPSASETTDPEDCPVATDDKGGLDNTVPLPDDPWYLNASSLLLKGADYQGIVKVRTANGTTKEVLKYVISDGTDIGDLHQTVKDPLTGKTYHVQAAEGSTSTIRDGDTVMYTESISGNLLGLIPVTFSPENPPPLNIPLIYFTKVKVVQAGQFGGTLHVPGLHQFVSD